jgi:hypothetical protein
MVGRLPMVAAELEEATAAGQTLGAGTNLQKWLLP